MLDLLQCYDSYSLQTKRTRIYLLTLIIRGTEAKIVSSPMGRGNHGGGGIGHCRPPPPPRQFPYEECLLGVATEVVGPPPLTEVADFSNSPLVWGAANPFLSERPLQDFLIESCSGGGQVLTTLHFKGQIQIKWDSIGIW